MTEIASFEVKLKPVAWRLIQENGKNVLSKAAKNFQIRFKRSVKKQIGLITPSEKEIGLFIELFERYDASYRTPTKKPIPDMDHVVTLIQNSLNEFFFLDDRQVSLLYVRRWPIPNKSSDSIKVRVYEL